MSGIFSNGANRPRILLVGAFPAPGAKIFGGVLTSCRALMASSLPDRADLILLDSTQISNPPPRLPMRIFLAARRFVAFLWHFERQQPDAALLFCSAGASLVEKGVMARYIRLRGVPALLFPRSGVVIDQCSKSGFTRAWTRIALNGATRILCQGTAWQNFAVRVIGLSRENAPVIPNWTATPELLEIGRSRQQRTEDRPRLLFLGRLEDSKGIFDLLEVCRRLREHYDFSLDVAGEGYASQHAREVVREFGLDDRVTFRGWLQDAELHQQLATADILVLPSWAEGLPNAMIEAMAARLAVVVSAVGNIPDFVADGQEALLVQPRDESGLQRALERLIADPVLRGRIADAGHALAARQWGVEQAVDGILVAVGEVVTAANRRSAF